MENFVISFENVTKTFSIGKEHSFLHRSNLVLEQKRIVAVDNVSFTIKKGETIGIIGLNGSGKTSLLRLIAGIYSPESGKIHVNGNLAPLLQIGTGFNQDLNAEENIILYGMLLGFTKSEITKKIDKILEFAELKKFRHTKLRNFSTGMRARLGFGTAIQINPDILLVDEVLSVGDAVFREKSFEAFLSFKKSQKTVVYTTHNINLISELSDRVIFIDSGKIQAIDTPKNVIDIYKNFVEERKKI